MYVCTYICMYVCMYVYDTYHSTCLYIRSFFNLNHVVCRVNVQRIVAAMTPEVKQCVEARGHYLEIIPGGCTLSSCVCDTHRHRLLRKSFRAFEQELMRTKRRADPNKIPKLSKDDALEVLDKALWSFAPAPPPQKTPSLQILTDWRY